MANNPFRSTPTLQTTLRDIILQNTAQSIRFHEDITSFILKLLNDARAADEKVTLAKNQLEGVFGGDAIVTKFKTENDKFNALLMATRMNSSKGHAVINDFRSELLPFFSDNTVSTEDKLIEFGGYLEQLDGCGAETRRIDGEFDTLCQNINSFRGEIAKTVEKMNAEDRKTIEKTQRKLEDVNARILAVEGRMSSTIENLRYQLGDIFQQFLHLTTTVLYSIIYRTQYTNGPSQPNGHYQDDRLTRSGSGGGGSGGGFMSRFTNWASYSSRYDEVDHYNGRHEPRDSNTHRRGAGNNSGFDSQSRSNSTREPLGPPSYSATPPSSGDEAARRAERELGRVHIRQSELPSQRDMQSNIQDLEELTADRVRYMTRIDDLNTKIALRLTIADVIGDLPEEIRCLASDVINFIDIYPQLKTQCETLRGPIAGGASTSSELQTKIMELTQLLPALERGLRAYAVARTEADVNAQMSR